MFSLEKFALVMSLVCIVLSVVSAVYGEWSKATYFAVFIIINDNVSNTEREKNLKKE